MVIIVAIASDGPNRKTAHRSMRVIRFFFRYEVVMRWSSFLKNYIQASFNCLISSKNIIIYAKNIPAIPASNLLININKLRIIYFNTRMIFMRFSGKSFPDSRKAEKYRR